MDDDEQPTDPQRRPVPRISVLFAVALALVTAGAGAIVVGVHAQRHAPQPPASAAVPIAALPVEQRTTRLSTEGASPAGAGQSASGQAAPVRGPILAAAVPTRLSVPSIGVNSSLLRLGENTDHTVQVPPQTRKAQAGWYRYSPTPGQLGPAIILGHVDSAKYGPGVFFKLGALRPGATVSITRADHSVAVFRVERVVSYPKNAFPTFDVYGNTDHAALRLITCGGSFDVSKHSYESNIVAYASLVSSHKA